MKGYRLVLQYGKENGGQMLLTLGSNALFFLVCFLYQLPLESLVYALGLSLVAFVLYHGVGFWRFVQGVRQRRRLMQQEMWQSGDFPETVSLAEQDYQKMLVLLSERMAEQTTQWEMYRQDGLDYYTAWVHQIKTPIAVMELRLKSEDTPEHRALLAELFRMEQYVEMVLGYLRLESDAKDLVLQELDLDPIIREAIRKFAPQFINRRLHLCYEPIAKHYITDEKWFVFLLEQLISNAIKYTPEGTVTIALSADGNCLQVRDTGIGIAPEDLPRIFEKGYTGYNGRADKKATGLGLYLCSRTARLLGLGLSAVSTPGQGSTFSIELRRQTLEVE
jgi:hypothetical protein